MSNHLFALIKSLNMSEKRHFKLFASKHVKGDKNNYVRLFDAIERQDEYNEAQLIKSENYVSDFAALKAWLYTSILKSLRAYNANTSIRNKLKGDIDYIEILLNKGLTEQAKKILQKAKKKAEKFEFWEMWMELFNSEINILKAENYKTSSISDIDNHFSEYRHVLNKQLDISNNMLFRVVAFAAIRKHGQAKDVQGEKKLKNIIKPYYITDDKALSFSALIQNYSAKSVLNTTLHNYQEALVFKERALKLMEQRPHYIDNNAVEYAKYIYNYILSNVVLRRFTPDVFIYINKLKQINFDSENEKRQYLMTAYFLEITIYCYVGEFEKGIQLINKIRKLNLLHLENKNQNVEIINVSLYYFIAYTYFGIGDYKQSGKYLNGIINYNSSITEDYNKLSKILRIIVDFEMRKLDSLEYSIKSAYRYLYKKQVTTKAEVLLLKFIEKQLRKQFANRGLIESFKELRTELKKLKDNRFEKPLLNDFDYISWLESKIEGRSFTEIVRKKALQNKY